MGKTRFIGYRAGRAKQENCVGEGHGDMCTWYRGRKLAACGQYLDCRQLVFVLLITLSNQKISHRSSFLAPEKREDLANPQSNPCGAAIMQSPAAVPSPPFAEMPRYRPTFLAHSSCLASLDRHLSWWRKPWLRVSMTEAVRTLSGVVCVYLFLHTS